MRYQRQCRSNTSHLGGKWIPDGSCRPLPAIIAHNGDISNGHGLGPEKGGEFLQGSQEITIGVIDAPALQIDLAALGSGIWGHTEPPV